MSVTFFLDEIFQAHAMGSQRAVTQPVSCLLTSSCGVPGACVAAV